MKVKVKNTKNVENIENTGNAESTESITSVASTVNPEKPESTENTRNQKISLLTIFLLMFKLSAFTFGGGYVIISMMQKEFVEKRGWLTEEEMQDITVVAQSAPGPVAVNSAIMMGYKLRGTGGIAVASIGIACPPLIILTIISAFYTQFKESVVIASILLGLRAGVAAIVMDVALSMCTGVLIKKQVVQIVIMFAAFIAVAGFGISAIVIIMGCLLAGLVKTVVETKK